jgi:hypothetical protein
VVIERTDVVVVPAAPLHPHEGTARGRPAWC